MATHRVDFFPLTLAFALALSMLTACGGGASVPEVRDTGKAGMPWSLRAVSAAELTAYFREALGASGPYATDRPVLPPVPVPDTPGMVFATSASVSGTTLQEGGVDEADWIKSDGASVFSLDRVDDAQGQGQGQRNILRRRLLDPAGPALGAASSAVLPFSAGVSGSGLYLDGGRGRIVALGQSGASDAYTSWFAPMAWAADAVEAIIVDAGGANMQTRRKFRISAGLVGSRRVGSTLYLVTRSYPQVPGLVHWWNEGSTQTNAKVLESLTPAQVLPTMSVDDGPASPLVQASSCLVQDGNAVKSADIVSIVAIDLAAAGNPYTARCFAGGTEAFYMSVDSLYLATTRSGYTISAASPLYPEQSSLDIHKFALDGLAVSYRGSGNVTGHLGFDQNRKSFRMGDHEGALRVITQVDTQWWGPWIAVPVASAASDTAPQDSPGRLTILKEDAGQLVVTARLPNANRPQALGKPGEQLYASRFLGARGYLVTYRLTDPLYVLDLSDAADPKVAGELHVDGFSDYLFPLGDALLLGVGKDAVVTEGAGDGRFAWYQGVKVSLIDVSDPAQPREAARAVIGRRGTDATVLRNHHGIALMTTNGKVRISLPVNLNETPYSGATGAPNEYFQFTRTELRNFEVDLAQKTLEARSPLAASPALWRDITNDRSLLWNDQVHWYKDGIWQSAGW